MVEFADLAEEDLHRIFEGNVYAQLALIRAVLPQMVERNSGTIVNMISATAYQDPPARIGNGGWGMGYAMSKAALARVAPLLHRELEDYDIRLFSVDPGFVVTEKTEAARARRAVRAALQAGHATGHRRGDPLARRRPRGRHAARADRHGPARDQTALAAARLAVES